MLCCLSDVHAILSSLHMLLLKGSSAAPASEESHVHLPQSPHTIANNQQLVAAAVSRLCLVLCAEWGKPVTNSGHGFNEFGFSNMPAPDVDHLPSSVLDFHRKLSGTGNSTHSSGGKSCK
jgi:hypothetical protein